MLQYLKDSPSRTASESRAEAFPSTILRQPSSTTRLLTTADAPESELGPSSDLRLLRETRLRLMRKPSVLGISAEAESAFVVVVLIVLRLLAIPYPIIP